MINQYLFVEEGSLAPNDIAKIVENIKNTGTSLIMYNKGCAKPELVSMGEADVGQIICDARNNQTAYLMSNLLEYLYHVVERRTHAEFDDVRFMNIVKNTVVYNGTVEELVQNFKDYLSEKGDK